MLQSLSEQGGQENVSCHFANRLAELFARYLGTPQERDIYVR
jgi:hypothetical protein